jgi:branched-chain amino acid aminotransferase
MVRGGKLVTPGVNDDILEGITRAGIIEIAAELGISVVERQIDRSELYIADEIFLVGTGAQVSPVIEVDHRIVGTGAIGDLTKRIQGRYFDAVRGKAPAYKHWLTPIY